MLSDKAFIAEAASFYNNDYRKGKLSNSTSLETPTFKKTLSA
jgi:hypothetical protein